MPVTLSPAVSNTNVKMRWLEPYVSDGLNKKLVPIAPAGIYRGLLLAANIASPRQVDVVPDPTHDDHLAIYETAGGHSLTYRDMASGTFTVDLDDASLDSTTAVLALYMSYVTSTDTVSELRAYTLTEYNALSASARGELVVLGSIAVGAPGANITAADITYERRSLPINNARPGMSAWEQLFRNHDFEWSTTGTAAQYASIFWDRAVTVGTGSWTTDTTNPSTGTRDVTLEATVYPITGRVQQTLYIPVTDARLLRIVLSIKQLVTLSSGTVEVFFDWATGSDTTVTVPMTGVDASYRQLELWTSVPAGSTWLLKAGIRASAATFSSTGDVFRVDSFQIYIEKPGAGDQPLSDLRQGQVVANPLIVTDGAVPGASGQGAVITYSTFLNALTVANRDAAGSAPAIWAPGDLVVADDLTVSDNALVGGDLTVSGDSATTGEASVADAITVGSGLLGSVADANVPRILVAPSVFAGVEYTLVHQSGSGSNKAYRQYVGPNGEMVSTVNAYWNNTTDLWTKDVLADYSIRQITTHLGVTVQRANMSLAPWADGAWSNSILSTSDLYVQIHSSGTAPTSAVNYGFTEGSYGMFTAYFGAVSTGSAGTGNRWIWPGWGYDTADPTNIRTGVSPGGGSQTATIRGVYINAAAGPAGGDQTFRVIYDPRGDAGKAAGPATVSTIVLEEDETMASEIGLSYQLVGGTGIGVRANNDGSVTTGATEVSVVIVYSCG